MNLNPVAEAESLPPQPGWPRNDCMTKPGMNLTWKSSKNCPKKTPESKADSAYLSPSSDYFWWFDGWSMHQYSQVLRVGVDVLRKKIRKTCEMKRQVP